MKSIFIYILVISSSLSYSQTYELFNNISNYNEVSINKEFIVFENESFIERYLTNSFFKSNWSPISSKNTPDINLFFDNVNFRHLRFDALQSKENEAIDFSKLNKYYLKVDGAESHFKQKESYLVSTKPLFNCSKNWAIIYSYSVFKKDVASSGDLYIYRKVNNKWILYHKVNIWVS